MILRAIADKFDTNITCEVQDEQGRCIAILRPRIQIPLVTRATADLEFEIVRSDNVPLLYLTRYGGSSGHVVQVRDPAGRDLGQLRQTNSFWHQVRKQRMTMALAFANKQLGQTEICLNAFRGKKAEVHEAVYNMAGEPIAYVDREWHRRAGSYRPQFDYTLASSAPSSHPLPTLLLATALAHYIYDRLSTGGPARGQRWTSWHN